MRVKTAAVFEAIPCPVGALGNPSAWTTPADFAPRQNAGKGVSSSAAVVQGPPGPRPGRFHMPWRDLLSSAQRAQLLTLPTTLREFEELYTLTLADLELVAARRTATNRLGIAVHLFLSGILAGRGPLRGSCPSACSASSPRR